MRNVAWVLIALLAGTVVVRAQTPGPGGGECHALTITVLHLVEGGGIVTVAPRYEVLSWDTAPKAQTYEQAQQEALVIAGTGAIHDFLIYPPSRIQHVEVLFTPDGTLCQ